MHCLFLPIYLFDQQFVICYRSLVEGCVPVCVDFQKQIFKKKIPIAQIFHNNMIVTSSPEKNPICNQSAITLKSLSKFRPGLVFFSSKQRLSLLRLTKSRVFPKNASGTYQFKQNGKRWTKQIVLCRIILLDQMSAHVLILYPSVVQLSKVLNQITYEMALPRVYYHFCFHSALFDR